MASALHLLQRVVQVVAAGRPNDENLAAGVMPAPAARLYRALIRLIALGEDRQPLDAMPRPERRRWRWRCRAPTSA